MIQTYIDALNNNFKEKNSFYKDHRYNMGANSISNIIIKLNDLGYDFTQKDFDNILKSATYMKGFSYLLTKSYFKEYYELKKKVIKIMFEKFTPTNKQFDFIISCYTNGGTFHYWIDVLLDKGYQLTNNQIQSLIKINYDICKIYNTIKLDNDLEKLKQIIQSFIRGITKLDVIKMFLKKIILIFQVIF